MSAQKKEAVNIDAKLRKELDALPTLSARIRLLDSKEWKTGDIARTLTQYRGKLVRYQHVRNVLKTPVKTPRV